MKTSFESWLEEKFINLGEWNERGITKDNCESGFEDWSSTLDVQEVIDMAEKWGKIVYIDGQKDGLERAKKILLNNPSVGTVSLPEGILNKIILNS